MPLKIPPNATILFQGDSITDAGRNYKDNASLGIGYAMIIAAWISATYPERNVRFLNRGKSGSRIRELKGRWQKDCLELRPSIVSILIGINDSLENHVWNNPTSTLAFEADYRTVLEQTRDVLNAQMIILEPFLLNITGGQQKLRENLIPKLTVVRKLAREYRALLIPLDEIFSEAARKREQSFWSLDGIHPTLAGHGLIARSWIKYACNSSCEI